MSKKLFVAVAVFAQLHMTALQAEEVQTTLSPQEMVFASLSHWSDVMALAKKFLTPEDVAFLQQQMQAQHIELNSSTGIHVENNKVMLDGHRLEIDSTEARWDGVELHVDPRLGLKQNSHNIEKQMGKTTASWWTLLPQAQADSATVGKIIVYSGIVACGVLAIDFALKAIVGAIELGVFCASNPASAAVCTVMGLLMLGGVVGITRAAQAKEVICNGSTVTIMMKDGSQKVVRVTPSGAPSAANAAKKIEVPTAEIKAAGELIKNSPSCQSLAKENSASHATP